ncbi:unnamed protein product [Euphydryas editha]|uniref:Uncharacterized protein n=1 Tax=Euphydryas editha TaxID=104508 RepID=A0AAU9TFW7_EUPED|nr:unnamed protein product [Euphydryas editha]
MFRLTVTCAVSILILCLNLEVKADNDREVRSARSDSGDQDFNSLLVDSFGNISSIISFLKSQVRDIVIDIGIEVAKFLRRILHEYKVKLFQRFSKYTISDVFHFVFDGIFEFVGEPDSKDDTSLENEAEPSSYNPKYLFPDPYTLEKLIQANRK